MLKGVLGNWARFKEGLWPCVREGNEGLGCCKGQGLGRCSFFDTVAWGCGLRPSLSIIKAQMSPNPHGPVYEENGDLGTNALKLFICLAVWCGGWRAPPYCREGSGAR